MIGQQDTVIVYPCSDNGQKTAGMILSKHFRLLDAFSRTDFILGRDKPGNFYEPAPQNTWLVNKSCFSSNCEYNANGNNVKLK